MRNTHIKYYDNTLIQEGRENRKIPLFLAAFLCQDLILPVLLL